MATPELTPKQETFLKVEMKFLDYYLGEITDTLGMEKNSFTVLRDSTLSVGYRADQSKSLLRSRRDCIQDSINSLI